MGRAPMPLMSLHRARPCSRKGLDNFSAQGRRGVPTWAPRAARTANIGPKSGPGPLTYALRVAQDRQQRSQEGSGPPTEVPRGLRTANICPKRSPGQAHPGPHFGSHARDRATFLGPGVPGTANIGSKRAQDRKNRRPERPKTANIGPKHVSRPRTSAPRAAQDRQQRPQERPKTTHTGTCTSRSTSIPTCTRQSAKNDMLPVNFSTDHRSTIQ